jgi:hypothetical protein
MTSSSERLSSCGERNQEEESEWGYLRTMLESLELLSLSINCSIGLGLSSAIS